MRVLIVNKFLFPKGGAEMYALSLGSIPEAHGHSVQYFGLRNPKNTVGNAVDALVDDMDFQPASGGISKRPSGSSTIGRQEVVSEGFSMTFSPMSSISTTSSTS